MVKYFGKKEGFMGLNNTKDRNIDQKFDMVTPPKKQAFYLKPIIWALSFPELLQKRAKIVKRNVEGLKPPYLMLCTHASFYDFKVATKAIFPHGATYVVAIDGFIHREGIMKKVGCIATRKFITDTKLVKQLVYSVDKLKQNVIIYTEARYSIHGTTAILPPSLGKLAKLLKVPVVVLNTHGHYLNSPVWNLRKNKFKTEAEMTQIVTKDEINILTYQEINRRIQDAFYYNEYEWQKQKGLLNKDPNRAYNLEKVLYKCPNCKREHLMISKGSKLICSACNKEYEYLEDGGIKAIDGITEFDNVVDWCEWERNCVKQEILKGEYRIEDDVDVDSLPNSKGFINMGRGHFIHDGNGLEVTFNENGEDKVFKKSISENYSCHIEFDYNKKGDGVSFSKDADTYYFYFEKLRNVIVKIHFAVEELFKIHFPNLCMDKQLK